MKSVIVKEDKKDIIIEMQDMKPFDIGIIIDEYSRYNNSLIMRTQSIDQFEVMNLSNLKPNESWCNKTTFKVKLLPPGTQIIFTI